MPVPAVTTGAMMMCSFGLGPAPLTVIPTAKVMIGGRPAATIMDSKPFANIAPFNMCISLANPTVASATAAALGVLTPMPCVPNTGTPWVPGSPTALIGNFPALKLGCNCMCAWGGVINLLPPGSPTTLMP